MHMLFLMLALLHLQTAYAYEVPGGEKSKSKNIDRNRKEELMLPTRDGVYLHTLVYLPKETDEVTKKFTTIVDRSPYGYGDMEWITDIFLPLGFAAVGQDIRGTEKSEGNYTMWARDSEDGQDLGAWIVQQPWSDGQVTRTCHNFIQTCHNFIRTCHNLTRTCHNLTRTCHNLTRTCHNFTRTCHNLTRTCHNFTRTCYNLTRTCHNLTRICHGQVYTFGASADGIASLQLPVNDPLWLGAQYIAWCPSNVYEILFSGGAYKQKTTEDWLLALTMPVPEAVYSNIELVHESENGRGVLWESINVGPKDFSHVRGRTAFWGGWYDLFEVGLLKAFDGYNEFSDPSVRHTR